MGDMKRHMKQELQHEETEMEFKYNISNSGSKLNTSGDGRDGLLVVIPEETAAEGSHHSPDTNTDTGADTDNPAKGTAGAATGTNPAQPDRGRQVQLVFTMQGMGIFFNSLVMTILLALTGQNGTRQGNNKNNANNNNSNYDSATLLYIWRFMYVLGAFILLAVLLSRYLFLKESTVWLDDKRRREQLARNAQAASNTAPPTPPPHPQPNQPLFSQQSLFQHQQQQPNFQPGSQNQQHLNENQNPFMGIVQSPSGISMVSDVSSLSAPSVAVHDFNHSSYLGGGFGGGRHNSNSNSNSFSNNCYDHPSEHDEYLNWQILHPVPSTDPEDDLKANTYSLLLRNYGVRLFGASVSWFLWDVAFYGNKLFQATFLLTLTGDKTTLLELSMAATLNAAVALAGYFGAAQIIDHPAIGRRGLQQWGFLLTGSLFVGVGFLYDNLSSAVLVAMYLGSTFFGQLGPNATTFLIPAEIFPTEMRTMCHGIAAASGKMGALLAAILFNYVDDLDMFLLSGYASFAACAVTFWTIPETTGLDLYETDRKWRMILDGRKGEYQGDANHPKFLSFYERNKNKASMYGQSSNHEVSAHDFDGG
jgi:hypothetical protein